MQIQNVVLHKIVFLAPRSLLMEGRLVVVAVTRHLFPARRHQKHQLFIALGKLSVSNILRDLHEGAQRFNRLDRQVCIVRQMTREVVGAQLVFRIHAFVRKIGRPLRQLGHNAGKIPNFLHCAPARQS